MLERLGIGGDLSFDFSGRRNMQDAAGYFDRLAAGAAELKKAGGGIVSIGDPIISGVKEMNKSFISFEQQMSAVSSKMGVLSQNDPATFAMLVDKAKELGASTAFSATEVGQGFELLATAGFTAEEQIAAIGGVLNTASADGIGLARATEIVAGGIRGMGLEASDTARVTNTLAHMSKSTMTDINQLGNALSYAMPAAGQLGIPIEDLSAALGSLGNEMIQSGRGGRNLASMLTKLVKPSRDGQEILDKFKFTMTEIGEDGTKRIKSLPDIVAELGGQLAKIEDPAERARAKAVLFGMEGARAWKALEDAGHDSLVALAEGAKEAQGNDLVGEMAKERLNNTAGAITILKSAIEGFSIEIMSAFGGGTRAAIEAITEAISDITITLQTITKGGDLDALADEIGYIPVAVGKGIARGLAMVNATFAWFKGEATAAGNVIGDTLGLAGAESAATMGTVGIAAIVTITPAIKIFGLLASVVTGIVIPAVSGLGLIVGTMLWPLTATLAGALLLFYAVREEGDSLGDTLGRMWDAVVATGMLFYDNVLKPIFDGVMKAADEYIPRLQLAFDNAFSALGGLIREVASLLGGFMSVLGPIFEWVADIITTVVFKVIIFGFEYIEMIATKFTKLLAGFGAAWKQVLEGDLLGAIASIGSGLIDYLLEPLRFITRQVIDLASAIPGGTEMIPEALVQWAYGDVSLDKAKKSFYDDDDEYASKPQSYYIPIATAAAGAVEAESTAQAGAVGAEIGAEMDAAIGSKLGEIAMNTGKECPPPELNVEMDGRKVMKGVAKHQAEMRDRLGQKATPFTRRMAAEQGAMT
jgi:TP901 family phage tail tape measure protein